MNWLLFASLEHIEHTRLKYRIKKNSSILPVFYYSVHKRVDFLDPVDVSPHHLHTGHLQKQKESVHTGAQVPQQENKLPEMGQISIVFLQIK